MAYTYTPSQQWLWWQHSSRVISLHSSNCSPPSTPSLCLPPMPQSPPAPVSPSQLAVTHLAPPGVHNWRLVCEEGQEFSARLRPSPLSVQCAPHEVYNCLLLASRTGSNTVQCWRERCVLLNSHWLDVTNWQCLVFSLLFPAIAPFQTDIHTPPSVQRVLVINPLLLAYEHRPAELSVGLIP